MMSALNHILITCGRVALQQPKSHMRLATHVLPTPELQHTNVIFKLGHWFIIPTLKFDWLIESA